MSNSTKDTTATKKKTNFFKGLKKEFKKISWPDKNDITKETTAVIIISLILGLVIALMDTVIQYGVDFLTTL